MSFPGSTQSAPETEESGPHHDDGNLGLHHQGETDHVYEEILDVPDGEREGEGEGEDEDEEEGDEGDGVDVGIGIDGCVAQTDGPYDRLQFLRPHRPALDHYDTTGGSGSGGGSLPAPPPPPLARPPQVGARCNSETRSYLPHTLLTFL